ncbi:MAG: LuxR C-terminal-related transcriptional regulator [Caulobacteraceae bacterium]
MSPNVEKLSEIIEAAAFDVTLWPKVLTGLADTVGAKGAALIYQSQVDGSGASVSVGIDPAAGPLYFGEFAERNPIQRANSMHERLHGARPRILNDEQLLPKGDLVRSDFYNGVMRPFGIHSIMTIGLGVRHTHTVGVNLVRGAKRPQFEKSELAAVARWHAKLIRAFDVGIALSPLSQVNADLAAVLDTLTDAVFVVDDEARVVYRNRRAGEMLSCGPLRMIRGVIRTAAPDEARALEALIARATQEGSPVGGAMAVAAPASRRPLSLTVSPLPSSQASLFSSPRTAMVRVADVAAPLPVDLRLLTELFSLTPAETRVAAALADGLSPRAVAERLGVSFNTVRAQLVSVYDKVGVSRQAELVRLMARLAKGIH